MSEKAEVDGYTAWVNVHLAGAGCQVEDVVMDLVQGPRLRELLQSVTGSAPKRLDSLDGLTLNQKVLRVDWFADALRASKKLPHSFKVDSKMISLQSADHLLPVLHCLMNDDIRYLYERFPLFLRRDHLHSMLAEPLRFGPCKITKDNSQVKTFYTTSRGKCLAQHLQRKCPVDLSAQKCVFNMVNSLLKKTTEGRRLSIEVEGDLVNSRFLCALMNVLIPETFPTEVIVNDRWTINLTLDTFSKIVCVKSFIDSEDLNESTNQSSTAFLAYVLMSGLQFSQAGAVVRRLEQLQRKQEELRSGLENDNIPESLQSQLDKLHEEMSWIEETYDHNRCKEWMEHANTIQTQVESEVNTMIQRRFSQVTVPRPMSINRLTESLVINLSLTGGSGFYLTESKEILWPSRRLVVQSKESGEYYEDFSGYVNHKGTVREMLGLHPYEIVEVNPSQHSDYLLFFESPSRNKVLKANTQFLYQVFPGTMSQCRRQLLRAARAGELETVKKLLSFFKSNKSFVNGQDIETGNTALHVASRYGHMEVMKVLLGRGALVDTQNNAGSTAFFLATEGLHKTPSLLLLEWGADIHIKNRISKTALEMTRNADLREFLTRKYLEYKELEAAVVRGDHLALENHIEKHITSRDPMASLTSRCIRGNTLLHVAASTGCLNAVMKLVGHQVRADIQNAQKATPLHVARDPVIMELLLEHNGDVNSVDASGNSPLHCLCSEEKSIANLPDCISLLVRYGAPLDVENNEGKLPIHCAASHGLTTVVDHLLSLGSEAGLPQDGLQKLLQESELSSLPYMALTGNHLHCSQWLTQHGFLFKSEELDGMLLKLLQSQPSRCSQLKECVQFIVEQGADVNTVYGKGNRPLHLAAQLTQSPEITDVFLDKGADANSTNSTGTTPLIAACQANNTFSASRLLNKGANVAIRDVVGKCAFEYIRDYEEWIQSGLFPANIISILRGYKLKQGKQLVNSVSQLLNTTHLHTSF